MPPCGELRLRAQNATLLVLLERILDVLEFIVVARPPSRRRVRVEQRYWAFGQQPDLGYSSLMSTGYLDSTTSLPSTHPH